MHLVHFTRWARGFGLASQPAAPHLHQAELETVLSSGAWNPSMEGWKHICWTDPLSPCRHIMASLPAYLFVAALALICTQSQTVTNAAPETAVAEQQAAPGPLLGQTSATASAQQTPATASAPVIAIVLAPAPSPGGGSLPSVACGDLVVKTQVG